MITVLPAVFPNIKEVWDRAMRENKVCVNKVRKSNSSDERQGFFFYDNGIYQAPIALCQGVDRHPLAYPYEAVTVSMTQKRKHKL